MSKIINIAEKTIRDYHEQPCETLEGPREALTLAEAVIELHGLGSEVAASDCLRMQTAFRGECGRDGQPEDGWCFVCRAAALLERLEQGLPKTPKVEKRE